MAITELVKALMASADVSQKEAEEIRQEMRERVAEGENPEDVLYEYGLEPDYVFDIL